MEILNNMLESGTAPVLTAFALGLLTAVSPCPLATNITAVGYISKDIENRKAVFRNGLLYTLGRIVSYTALGVSIIPILRRGASVFTVQRFLSCYGEAVIGPLLILFGVLMLFGRKLQLRGFGSRSGGEGLKKSGGVGALLLGMLFALAFCPTSGLFYFGMLMPLSASASGGYLLPIVFAVATALPVIAVAWILAFSVASIGLFYNRMQAFGRWFNFALAVVFIGVGAYFTINAIL